MSGLTALPNLPATCLTPSLYQHGLEMQSLHTYTLTFQYHTAALSQARYVAVLQVTQCYVPYLSGLQLFEHSPTAARWVTAGQKVLQCHLTF